MPTIVIDGIIYVILKEKEYTLTPKEVSPLNKPVTRTDLTLKRPSGKRTYYAVRYENGLISSVV